MVVQYPSSGEASWTSFFTITPKVLFYNRGSIFPQVLPQIVLVVIVSIIAVLMEDSEENPVKISSGNLSVLGFLLSFLIVFKTNSGYQQFWTALTAVDGLMQLSRTLGMMVCTDIKWGAEGVEENVRTCLRLLGLHFYVLIEKFHRTGKMQTGKTQKPSPAKAALYNKWRGEIRKLANRVEMELLYPGEDPDTPGSESKYGCANPNIVLFWLKLLLGHLLHDKAAVAAPILNGFSIQINMLMGNAIVMEKIDKTQFPLPYAQIVKLYLFVFVFIMPFVLAKDTGWATPFIAALAALGFYGLDEVAEIMESPFGQDANDIDLTSYGRSLVADLGLFYNMKRNKLEKVIGGEQTLCFKSLLSEEQGMESQMLLAGFHRASSLKIKGDKADGAEEALTVNTMATSRDAAPLEEPPLPDANGSAETPAMELQSPQIASFGKSG
eukprot:TRINITY_DN114938_c0_g1_i1.p1 TRINITY_DN114938_c0_g1~~TRINITY_DN114938_c0_g1_i1.p1  ORF type:complete len:439 (-),score=108.78 TRINITY_DN114938_c0_g1_i1:272-1588(-)